MTLETFQIFDRIPDAKVKYQPTQTHYQMM